jgi:hypothetical protein
VWSQNGLSEPVYRVAADAAASQTSTAGIAAATTPAVVAPANGAPFDMTKQGNEHDLMPVIRALQASQAHIDQNIRDYTCTFVKHERVDGVLGEQQFILLKVMNQPFSVYMRFIQPFAGREVVFVDGQNENKLTVLEAGFKRYAGKLSLDPNGAMAMKGNKHPITSVGIRNLTAKLIKLFEEEAKFAECEVTVTPDTKVDGRQTLLVQVKHPIPRQSFRAHIMRIFFDNEHKVPIHFDAYLWPAQTGAKPPLDEAYTYQNLKVNNNFTAMDFDANNNPNIFQ